MLKYNSVSGDKKNDIIIRTVKSKSFAEHNPVTRQHNETPRKQQQQQHRQPNVTK